MNKIFTLLKKEIFPISLILILVFSRVIPHPPNFTPVIAVGIMSGYLFKNIYISITTVFISMLLADAFIGFHENMFFVYLSLLSIAFVFYKIRKKINYKNLLFFSFFGSVFFFIISNFGVWILGNLYERNINGLIECYFMAIPFFKNTLISTLIFSYATFLTSYFHIKKLSFKLD